MTAILVVDDEPVIRTALVERLDEEGFDAVPAESLAEARAQLAARKIDAILLDIRLRDGDGLDLLDELRRAKNSVPVIVATAFGDSERAIRAMRLGAFEYVTKPFDLDALLATMARAVETPAARGPEPEVRGMIGSSPKMLDVWKSIGRAAASDVPVLVTGETGVGKELVARAIHDHGDRRDKPLVAVNLAALPPALLESELFGHERGAFTGAAARREGRFELAGEGTLFLDEIADLDQPLQTKLLRVLEDGRFERVGGGEPLESHARIISATSRPTRALREDLYYRLGVLRIDVPPLRERRQDIPALVQAFLAASAPPRRAISEAALDRLVEYHWPGNVRELRHVIQHACVMSAAEVLAPADFALRAAPAEPAASPPTADAHDLDLKAALDRLERSMIEQALARAKGNRAEAARLLGIRRALLYARLRYHGFAT
ncbi:MAG TPA: sigma-54 dependent transcriptional regulator [Kofleriaceae bacterium]|jgi:DNA-binding NtrC family response regulator